MIKTILLILPLIFTSALIDNNTPNNFRSKKLASPIELIESAWIDSLMSTMTLEEKVAQLFMIPVYANQNRYYEQKLIDLVSSKQIGGIILMKGSPYNQTVLTNKLQSVSNVPLMVSIDGEWGLAMRTDSIEPFPKAMALGAVSNDQLVFDLGYDIARQCRRMGIHINFAPVLDINSNYNNPIINMRAFGDNKKNVARKGLAYAIGMQNNGVLAVGKHFPGHGSTSTDSHKTMPTIYLSKEQLVNNDMFPFKKLIQNELGGIMVAHIAVPSLNSQLNRPASFSSIVIDTILKKQMGFKGLVFTDALNMKGATKNIEHGQIEVEALLAGNDVLLYPENIKAGISAVIYAVHKGVIDEEKIDEKCLKVLKAKQWFGLNNYRPTKTDNLLNDINSSASKYLKQKIVEASITLIKNSGDLLPFKQLNKKRILCISMGAKPSNVFQKYLTKYTRVDTISCSKWPSKNEVQAILDTVKGYTHVIIGQHGVSEWPFRHFKLSESNIALAEQIAALKPTILGFFGNPYALRYYKSLNMFKSVLLGYSDEYLTQKFLAQSIFGGIGVHGVLPVTINNNFPSGTGLFYNANRIKYSAPCELGLSDTAFVKVDSIAQKAIEIGAIPGCQIFYVKKGKVIYNKNFGYHTYKNEVKVNSTDIYDIASVTKVAATTMLLMHMFESNQIDLTAKLSKYLPELDNTDKKKMHINQILAHHSGLHSWIPFYRNTLTGNGELRADLYKSDSSKQYSVKVGEGIFMRNDYVDSVFQAIIDTPLYHKKKYRYSDLGFYLMAKLINKKTGNALDVYADNYYYSPLGMNFTVYNPWRFKKYFTIVPSEDDKIFRKQVIIGYVNDPGAAMLGGVSGHAGLFSNANDLGKLGQLLLNKGIYGGEQYFLPKTLDIFNKSYYKRKGNRRALGFDKPVLHKNDIGPTCPSASQQSFGHSGFTGAYFWVDPNNQSIFIFLSNRTYPDQNNKKLVDMNIRTDIQQVFYNVVEH